MSLNPYNMIQYVDTNELDNALKLLVQNYGYVLNSIASPNGEAGFQYLIEEKAAIVLLIRRSFMFYKSKYETVSRELQSWKRQQALAKNGAPFNEGALGHIQCRFEQLETFIAHLLDAIKKTMWVHLSNEEPELTQLHEQIQNGQKTLLLEAFIVEEQPPQVLKKNTRFPATVRWLTGSTPGIHSNPPTVQCIIMKENDAREVTRGAQWDTSLVGESPGVLENCSSKMEYHKDNNVFSATFQGMLLKNIKRTEKKSTQCVMEEKFALVFYATATVNDYQIRVFALSLPVVAIVHGNQEPQSWATITWDNAFAEIVRDPFMVTDRVTWAQLSVALSTKFGSGTLRSLTTDNLNFLYAKLPREERSEYISWNQFCKEPMPGSPFTLWEWFFATMKLTKDHLLDMWNAGVIMGFIGRAKAKNNLLRSSSGIGTFLIRFAEGSLGAITIAYVTETGQVEMLGPWTASDFQVLSFGDYIRDLNNLRWLHPSDPTALCIDRDTAFKKFFSKRAGSKSSPGYEKGLMVFKIPAPHQKPTQLENSMELDSDDSPAALVQYLDSQPPVSDALMMTKSYWA